MRQDSVRTNTIPRIRWAAGFMIFAVIFGMILIHPFPVLFYQDLPHMGFFKRAFYILLLSFSLCFYRVCRGPTAPDRVVATDLLSILIVGFCALMNLTTNRSWYIDIGIAWSLQSFVASLALSKYLEGRGLDD